MGEIKIKKANNPANKIRQMLNWSEKESEEIGIRILNLRNDQIVALTSLVGVIFSPNNREEILNDIRKSGNKSGHLSIIIYEADSKENMLWWLNFFEKYNKILYK